jgi:hypothetical protein
MSFPLKSWMFCHCHRTSTFFYLEGSEMWTFCHMSPGNTFWLVLWEVDKMSQWSKSSRRKLLKVAVTSKRVVGLKKLSKNTPFRYPLSDLSLPNLHVEKQSKRDNVTRSSLVKLSCNFNKVSVPLSDIVVLGYLCP